MSPMSSPHRVPARRSSTRPRLSPPGIPLDGVAIRVTADLDPRGFPGRASQLPRRMHVDVRISSVAAVEGLVRLIGTVNRHCSMPDILRRPLPVTGNDTSNGAASSWSARVIPKGHGQPVRWGAAVARSVPRASRPPSGHTRPAGTAGITSSRDSRGPRRVPSRFSRQREPPVEFAAQLPLR